MLIKTFCRKISIQLHQNQLGRGELHVYLVLQLTVLILYVQIANDSQSLFHNFAIFLNLP